MILHPAHYSTRSVSLVVLAALAGVALWVFAPWGWGRSGSGGPSAGNAETPPRLQVNGAVQVESHDGVVTRLVVPIALAGNDSIVLPDDTGGMRAETSLSETASAAVPVHYDAAWTDGNGDRVLDPGEHATLTVDLPATSSVRAENPLRLVIHAQDRTLLAIEGVLP